MNFRKLVTNLPFSPNLIHKVSFYAKRLRREEFTRRVGLVVMILAIIVQTFSLISPPQPTLAASGNDIVYGGVNGVGQILSTYDRNTGNFKDILNSFGISRKDLQKGHQAKMRYYDHNKDLYSMGRYPYGFKSEYAVKINNGQTYYMRQLAEWGNASDTVWKFQSGGRTFMILYHCGNLVSIGPSYPKKKVVNGICTVTTDAISKKLKPGQSFKANFTVKNTGNTPWGVYAGPGTKNAYILGTTSPQDNQNFGKNREAIPGSKKSVYGPLLEAGKTSSWSDNFTAPSKSGTYTFGWRVLQEGKRAQIGQSCATQIYVSVPPVKKCQYNPAIPPTDKDCVPPCTYDSSILSTDKQCAPCPPDNQDSKTNCIIISKNVANKTQKIDKANGTTAHAGDSLVYTLHAKNTGKAAQTGFVVHDNIGDILEYANITDLNGAKLDKKTHIISWAATDITANGVIEKSFTVKVKEPIPQTPQSISNPGSYDLKMTNVYGNTVNIKLTGSVPKATEQIVKSLPETGASTNIIIECAMFMLVAFFYMRSKQLVHEVGIVKNEFNYSGGN